MYSVMFEITLSQVLVYYGSQKERKLKRVGWTKPNAFHICITSYKLVIQVNLHLNKAY